MKITDYPSVDSLTDDDVILIDGNNGTKKLPGSYVKRIRDRLDRFEDPLQAGLVVPYDSLRNIDNIWKNSSVVAAVDGNWGILSTYVSDSSSGNARMQIFNGLYNEFLWKRRYRDSDGWTDWHRIDSGEDLFLTNWAPNMSYAVGNVRRYKNATYICKLAHTSSDQLLPTNTTYWDKKNTGTIIQDMKTSFQAGVDTLYNACVNKGQTPSSSTPSAIASAIAALVKPSGTKSITSNGTHDVSAYASASVSVPSTVYHNSDIIEASRTSKWYKYVITVGQASYIDSGTNMVNESFSISNREVMVNVNRDVPNGTAIRGNIKIGIY